MDEFKERFDKCLKSGGYKKYLGKWIWVNHKIKYFPQGENKIVNWGGVPNFIRKAKLVYLENSIIYPNKFPGYFNQKYTFYVKQQKIKIYDLEKAISFNIGGANSFQHFMQDCLPIIVKSKKFLLENSDVRILLPKANTNFTSREDILNKAGITNQIIETDQINSLKIRFLYFWDFIPYNSKYNLPPIFYSELRKVFIKNSAPTENRTIVLLVRSEKMRKFKNSEEIINCLKKLANLHDLDLLIVDTSFETFESISNKIRQAIVVIGVHGGGTYNSIFCPVDCTVVEIVPMRNTNSNINYISQSGINYVPFPIDFDFFDEEVEVPLTELNMVVSRLLS